MIIYGLIAVQALVGAIPQPSRTTTASPSINVGVQQSREEQTAFERRLEAVDDAMSKVTDLRANFEQRKRTPLLKKPMVSKGTVVTKGERVRWDTAEPRESSLVVGDGKVCLFYPADRLVEEYPAGEGFKDLAGCPLPRLAVLNQRFDIVAIPAQELGVCDPESTLLAIRLTPRGEDLQKHVESVRVLIDEATPAVIKVVITSAEGETTEILFSEVKTNFGVSDADVDLELPEGVRVSRPMGDGKGGAGQAKPVSKPDSDREREGPR